MTTNGYNSINSDSTSVELAEFKAWKRNQERIREEEAAEAKAEKVQSDRRDRNRQFKEAARAAQEELNADAVRASNNGLKKAAIGALVAGAAVAYVAFLVGAIKANKDVEDVLTGKGKESDGNV